MLLVGLQVVLAAGIGLAARHEGRRIGAHRLEKIGLVLALAGKVLRWGELLSRRSGFCLLTLRLFLPTGRRLFIALARLKVREHLLIVCAHSLLRVAHVKEGTIVL